MSKIGNSQTIDETQTNPVSTRAICAYKFSLGVPTNIFQYWMPPANAYLVNGAGAPDGDVFHFWLNVKWKNVESSANPCVLQAYYTEYGGALRNVTRSVWTIYADL
jgi:hypothetical protein